MTLSRYVERYGDPDTDGSGVPHHRVPVARMIRWMISQGIAGEAVSLETHVPGCLGQEPGNPNISAAPPRT